MPEFYSYAVIMVLVAMLFVLLPIMSARSQHSQKRSHVNVTVFKEQLAALEQALLAGKYSESEHHKLKTELERQLLEGAVERESDQQVTTSGRSRLVLAVLIPLLAFFVYGQIGALPDWQISRTLDSLQQPMDEISRPLLLEQLAEQLSQRIEQVDIPDYYMLLARTQLELNNYPAAVDAYRQLTLLAGDDPAVLGQYAQALYLASDRKMTPEVIRISEQALALNPHQPTVLGMLGIDSFESGDYKAAADYWERLLPSLPPESGNAQMIRQGIAQAREMAGDTPSQQLVKEPVVAGVSLKVAVSLSDTLTASPDASVFVFARAVSGPPMPLAVARLRVADLPAQVTLDDSMAMTPALKLSGFEQVEVVARISSRGIANRGSGDLEGQFGPISPADKPPQITVLIDKVLP